MITEHAEQNDTSETTTIDEDYETTTSAIDEDYETSAGHQMHRLHETLKRLEGSDWLGDDVVCGVGIELQAALGALDDVLAPTVHEHMFGSSDEDIYAEELVGAELAAINRRLDTLLALGEVKAAARRLGRAACRLDAEDESGTH